jgi:replicative DNA helicase
MKNLQNAQSDDFKNAPTIISDTRAYIHEMSNRGDKVLIGLDTGYAELNQMTSGFRKGDLIIIAARPSMGSTALALNITNNLLAEGKGIAIFSLEMSSEEMMLRLMSIQTSIWLQRLRLGKIDTEEYKRLTDAMDTMENRKLFIHDQSVINIDQICTKLRQLKSQNPDLDLAVIDSLQMIRSSAGETVGEILCQLKMLARELEIPIIVLSKLNSKLEWRTNKRPILSDIPESDLIEPYADTILFIYRNDFYLYNEEKDREQRALAAGQEFISRYVEKEEEEAEIIIAKQRNGAVGQIKLMFQKKFTRFVDRPSFANIPIVYENV